MTDDRRTYRVQQLGRPQPPRGGQQNEDVASLEGLVTHHPGQNRNIHMQDGVILDRQKPERRSHAYISGDFEEIIDNRVDRYDTLQPNQVLLVKDFILEDPIPSRGKSARAVDIPSPTAGYVSSVRPSAGFVELMDREDGMVIARLRHMSDISVQVGDTVAYGQRLGQQNNLGLDLAPGKAMHAHVEMDIGHYQQFRNYMDDLASGRLPVQAQYRNNVQPQPVIDDGTFRLGQSNERIRDLQRVMTGEGYRSANGGPLDQDGVYRPSMQGALLDFQRAHGLPQTGDIDPATLGMAPPAPRRVTDHHDYTVPGQAPHATSSEFRAPAHPEHSDHRQCLSDPLPPPVNQPSRSRHSPADRDHPDHAMLERIREGVRKIDADIGKPHDETSERLGRCLLLECKDRGLHRVDHVVMGRDGTNLFAVQGQLTDPAHLRVHVSTEQAIRTPVEQADERLLAVNQAIAQEQERARQLVLARGPEDLSHGGPVMR